MLVRGSKRKLLHRRDTSRALEQLQLPWLCPALNQLPAIQPRASFRATTTTSTPPAGSASRASSTASTVHSAPLTRRVATAPGTPNPTKARGFASPAYAHDDYVPFDPQSVSDAILSSRSGAGDATPFDPNLPAPSTPARLSDLRPFDPSLTHKLDETLLSPSAADPHRLFRRARASGLGGSVADLHAIFQAYLHLGQLDRASAAIRRLHDIYAADAPDLHNAHLAYIAAVASNVVITRDPELSRHLRRWFNEDVRAKGVRPSGAMVALLVQAGLRQRETRKVDRTVRGYLHAAKREGILDEAWEEMEAMLSVDELRVVREASPESLEVLGSQPGELEPATKEKKETPVVMAQQQKGQGLIALQKSLAVFAGEQPLEDLEKDLLDESDTPLSRQERLERDTVASAIERWHSDHEETVRRSGTHGGLQKKWFGKTMWTWHESLLPLVKDEIKKAKNPADKSPQYSEESFRLIYGPFLQYLSPEALSATTIITFLNTITTSATPKAVTLVKLVMAVGKAIEEESRAEMLQMQKRNLKRHSDAAKATDPKQPLVEPKDWPTNIRANVGAVLVSFLLRTAKVSVPEELPNGMQNYTTEEAFGKFQQYTDGKAISMIRMHEELSSRLCSEPVGSVIAKHLPMLTEPEPWTDLKSGGYLHQSTDVVRAGPGHSETKDYVKLASEGGDMAQVYAGLDVLGRTPWRINRSVFNAMLDVWNTGEELANIPPSDPKLEYPPEPEDKEDLRARRLHAYQRKQIDNQRDGMHSNRCFQNFQLEVAKAYLDETFYFPHNVDFRGRAYPMPPYLNHMGADHVRGLLKFGKGKELGEKGLYWLKVHLANVFGYDKASLSERFDFAEKHMDDIIDSAENPLSGNRWWLEADSEWQCLAACIELNNAMKSPDPAKFVSHLPVHQDGTCNGLQHYAALGGDAIGARQVNLEPGDRPSDIYTAVSEMVKSEIAKDAEQGDALAKVLEGKVTRKVVKQTVMTNVYGVTFAGAKMQVCRQLDDLYPNLFSKDDPHGAMRGSMYIARKIFAALSAMFNGAHDIQNWLGECGARICDSVSAEQVRAIEAEASSASPFLAAVKPHIRESPTSASRRRTADEHTRFKTTVVWTTPLRMPVVQPYRKTAARLVRTRLPHTLSLVEPARVDPVAKRKQLQAFPPNFIHSLDATHMLLSALACDALGLSFAAVHDSFWTHAADVDRMNVVIRDAFVRMHSDDVVGRLKREFEARYAGAWYVAWVRRASPLGRRIAALEPGVRRWGRVKTDRLMGDLVVERERRRLLESTDAEEVKKGEAMVTAASLYAEAKANGEADFEVVEEVEGGLGVVREGEADIDAAAKEAAEAEAEAAASPEELERMQKERQKEEKRLLRNKAVKRQYKVPVWLPLTFPDVPAKGSFDVTRLKESKYFFS